MVPRRGFVLFGVLVLVAGGLGAGLLLAPARAAKEPPKITPEVLAWWHGLQKLRAPKGCSTANFPKVAWVKAQCGKPPRRPYGPRSGFRPYTVGNGNDFSGRVTSGLISSAEGSFASSNATSETDSLGRGNNVYSLQLNTSFFPGAPLCSGHSGCMGWEQFIYSSANAGVFIQFWLINYNATCPSGWNTFGVHCWRNSTGFTQANGGAALPVTDLTAMSLYGDVTPVNDTVEMLYPAAPFSAVAQDTGSVQSLASHWTESEFAIVGDGGGSQANFNGPTTLTVRTTEHHGSTLAPVCEQEGFTGETNNLDLVGTPAVGIGPSPSILSVQSNSAGTASCQPSQGIGDTHLTTFSRLLYDFQATGDFVLTQAPNFLVENRQVSGAPTWPKAAVNKAVAARFGSTRVAVCLPNQLQVNGKTVAIRQGVPVRAPGGVDVLLTGNQYLIRGPQGDNVRAEVNNGWINVYVGLGQWPESPRGLLANVNDNPNKVATSNGLVLNEPLTFPVLYHRYGDSWRVKPGPSILCGKPVQPTSPTSAFYSKDLKPDVAARAKAICLKFGVKEGPLLDACTLDVAVIGQAAAKAYVGATPPAVVAIPPG
jgi:hypothetical protein